MSKSINDIRCEFLDNSRELIQNIMKYHYIVMNLQNINLLSFKIIKNQEEFTSLIKLIIDLNEKIKELDNNFKNVIKEEELPNLKEKTSTPMNPMMFDFPKEKPSTPESNKDMNSTMNPMMGGMGMNPMMGGMGMNPMMFGFQSPMMSDFPVSKFPENTESTKENESENIESTKENESENTESTNKTNKEDLN